MTVNTELNLISQAQRDLGDILSRWDATSLPRLTDCQALLERIESATRGVRVPDGQDFEALRAELHKLKGTASQLERLVDNASHFLNQVLRETDFPITYSSDGRLAHSVRDAVAGGFGG